MSRQAVLCGRPGHRAPATCTAWYGEGEARVEVLKGVDVTVQPGEYVAIMGASGSGKSTLLSILGCLDRPGEGRYHLAGQDVLILSDDRLSEMRLRTIGFVFQSFQLIPQMTILENAEMPLFYAGVGRRRAPGAACRGRCSNASDCSGTA